MKNLINLLIIGSIIFIALQAVVAQTNLIQNGGFENINESCCSASTVCQIPGPYTISYFNNTSAPAYYTPFNNLCVSNWKASQGSADIGKITCPINPKAPPIGCDSLCKAIHELPCYGNFAGMGAVPQYGLSEGIFTDNLNLSPDSIYTLTFLIASPNLSYNVYIKLTNQLVNQTNGFINGIPLVSQSQTVFSRPFISNSPYWESITIDFIPNQQYSQLWIYLTSGWINVDNFVLKSKALYTGPKISNYTCCGPDVVYANTTVPTSTTNKQSILVGPDAAVPASQSVVLSAGSYVKFTPNFTFKATNTTSLMASIANCKAKPSVDYFGGAGSNANPFCFYSASANIGQPNKIEQGVNYNWTANPSSALNYVQNISSPYTSIVTSQSLNATYTLTASNNCGSLSSSVIVTTSCNNSRIASDVINTDLDFQTDENNTFSCYPNPSQGSFIVKISNDLLNSVLIINDVNGNSIRKNTLSELENKIDLTNQKAGVYFITIISKGKTIKEKLVIL